VRVYTIKRLIISKINIDQRANITKAIDFILIKHCFQNTGQSNWLYFILIQTPSSKFSFSEKLHTTINRSGYSPPFIHAAQTLVNYTTAAGQGVMVNGQTAVTSDWSAGLKW